MYLVEEIVLDDHQKMTTYELEDIIAITDPPKSR